MEQSLWISDSCHVSLVSIILFSVTNLYPTFTTKWTAVCQAPLSSIISWNMLKFMSIGMVTLFNHLILYHPLLLLSSFFPSISVFFNESALLIRCTNYWSSSVRQDWVTSLSLFIFMHWKRKWKPAPVFLPEGSQGWESLVGCRLWGHTESDMTEATEQQKQFQHQSFQWIFRIHFLEDNWFDLLAVQYWTPIIFFQDINRNTGVGVRARQLWEGYALDP